jgi:hypothetical protein
MLTRREAISGLGIALAGLAAPARAQLCPLSGTWGQCRAEIDYDDTYAAQQRSQWCWAACVEMMFSHAGHDVSQSTIVEEAYGGIANIPAQAWQVSSALNRTWEDDDGGRFKSRLVAAYDQDAGVYAISDAFIVNSLANDRPLVLGATGHAVLLTAIEYDLFNNYPVVKAAECFDPWPGRGERLLTVPELFPAYRGGALRYLAAIRIEDLG